MWCIRWNGSVAWLTLGLLGLAACKPPSSDRPNAVPAAASAARAAAELEPKLRPYVEHCLNAFTKNVYRSIEHYYAWAPKDQPPSEKTKDIKGILSIYIDPNRCADAVAKANAMAPKEPVLEQAATRFVSALIALRPPLDVARVYYENRGYKQDGFTKAREMHQRIVQVFDEFEAANRSLADKIDELQDQEDRRILNELERAEGRKFPFLVRSVYVQAKAAMRVADKPAQLVTVEEYAKVHANVDKIVKELVAYRDANGVEAHRLRVQDYVQESEAFVRSSREFAQKLEDKQPARPNEVLRQYDTLVSRYNALRL